MQNNTIRDISTGTRGAGIKHRKLVRWVEDMLRVTPSTRSPECITPFSRIAFLAPKARCRQRICFMNHYPGKLTPLSINRRRALQLGAIGGGMAGFGLASAFAQSNATPATAESTPISGESNSDARGIRCDHDKNDGQMVTSRLSARDQLATTGWFSTAVTDLRQCRGSGARFTRLQIPDRKHLQALYRCGDSAVGRCR